MIERVQYFGWPNCYRLSNGEVEAIVSTDFGPRILRYAFIGQENILGEYPELSTPTVWGDWKPYGGHRLWVAPEEMPASYAPDNGPVAFEMLSETAIRLSQPRDAAGFEKEIVLTLAESGSNATLHHRLTNRTGHAVRVSAWGITIMRGGGGMVLIPQEPFRSHDECLVPARSVVLWHFTDVTDSRIVLGRKFILLRTDPAKPEPQKIGAANRSGWSAFHDAVSGTLFVKRASYDTSAVYPDFAANTEAYVAGEYIELETLGPLTTLQDGESVLHREDWTLFDNVALNAADQEQMTDALAMLDC